MWMCGFVSADSPSPHTRMYWSAVIAAALYINVQPNAIGTPSTKNTIATTATVFMRDCGPPGTPHKIDGSATRVDTPLLVEQLNAVSVFFVTTVPTTGPGQRTDTHAQTRNMQGHTQGPPSYSTSAFPTNRLTNWNQNMNTSN